MPINIDSAEIIPAIIHSLLFIKANPTLQLITEMVKPTTIITIANGAKIVDSLVRIAKIMPQSANERAIILATIFAIGIILFIDRV